MKNTLSLVAFFLIMAFIWSSGHDPYTEEWAEDNEVAAYVACKDLVRDKLKAPQSADFPRITQSQITYEEKGTFIVLSSVTAQNSFGANLKKSFVCETTYDADSDEWNGYVNL